MADSPALLAFLRDMKNTGLDFFDYAPPPGDATVGFLIQPDARTRFARNGSNGQPAQPLAAPGETR